MQFLVWINIEKERTVSQGKRLIRGKEKLQNYRQNIITQFSVEGKATFEVDQQFL